MILAVLTSWDWTEIGEGAAVSVALILLPLLWRIENHHLELRAHAEHQTMLAEETHYLAHHGKPHPRVQQRLDRGESRTPSFT